MPFEYESLVGTLYMVGGRAISAPPPGTLVEMAPRKAARGREADTFFALVLPSGDTVAPAAFYDTMVRDGATHYFEGSGSVTAGIRNVFTLLNNRLIEHNQADPRYYEASIIAGVLRGGEMIVGKAGSAVMVQRSKDGAVQTFPADLTDDDQIFTPPLGVGTAPDVRMTRLTITPGLRIGWADSSLADYPLESITTALALDDIGAVLATMREGIKKQITLLVVEFVSPASNIVATTPARVAESTTAAGASPKAAPPVPTENAAPPPALPRSARRGAAGRAVISTLAERLAKGFEVIMHIFNRLVPEPSQGERGWLASPTATGIAVLLPILLVVAVVLLWVSGTGESGFDKCVERALTSGQTARSVASTDVTGTVAAWNAVTLVVDECDALRADDPSMLALKREARSILDRLQNIARRPPTPIYAFQNAQLTDVVLQGDDMYVLDSNNQQVYRITLTEDGLATMPGSYAPIPAMRRSGRVVNFDVGALVDIAWAENGAGLSASNVITALDADGLLIVCQPRFLQDCTAQRLTGAETWQSPKSITYWEGRLYILDPAGNQIWRYDPSGGTFTGVPLEYFTGGRRPDITSAVDFSITSNGDVFLLLNTGVIAKFRAGDQLPFAFTFPDTQIIDSPSAFYLNPNPTSQGVYLIEQDQRTIFETTMAGTFINAYRAEDETLFASLNNVIVNSNQNVIYALSGNSIFGFPR